MSYDRFSAERDGFVAGLVFAGLFATVFAVGHWVGRTNAEDRAAAQVKAEKEEGR